MGSIRLPASIICSLVYGEEYSHSQLVTVKKFLIRLVQKGLAKRSPYGRGGPVRGFHHWLYAAGCTKAELAMDAVKRLETVLDVKIRV